MLPVVSSARLQMINQLSPDLVASVGSTSPQSGLNKLSGPRGRPFNGWYAIPSGKTD